MDLPGSGEGFARAKARRVSSTVLAEGLLRFDDAEVYGEDFSGTKLKLGFRGWQSSFTACSFERMAIGDAAWGGGAVQSRYVDCSFDGSRIGMRAPGNARFERCSFRNVQIKPIFSYACEFIDCVFSGVLEMGAISGCPFAEDVQMLGRECNRFEGNDLSGASIRDVRFTGGIDLKQNVLPAGSEYILVDRGASVFAEVRERASTIPDARLRADALIIIDSVLENTLVNGQEQVLYRHGDAIPAMARADDTIFDLLAATIA